MTPNIIGISAMFHDSACCILKEGQLVAAAQEERFTRIKFDPTIPNNAYKYCLEESGLSITDIDCVAFYENPTKKLARQLWSGLIPRDSLQVNFNFNKIEVEIREKLGYTGKILYFDHHLSHAASTYFYSGFQEASILTVDGVGEWATMTYGSADKASIELFEEVHFPNSIGLLYSTITSYLGFRVNSGEYKVMGLAPYGKPKYLNKLNMLIKLKSNGKYELDMDYFDFIKGSKMYSSNLLGLLGRPPREPESKIEQFHKDIAKSLQVLLESILLEKSNYLYKKTKSDNLCMAGGVALNCVANAKILREGKFKRLFVQPASNDAGGALGAAALAYVKLTGERPLQRKMKSVFLGPSFSESYILNLLESTSINFINYFNNRKQLVADVSKHIANGKIIGWFQGRMEFGPRALGARSILADPRNPTIRDKVNMMVKKRENFRPFAPAVLEERMAEHFNIDHPSPFMLETCKVISKLDLPAITHVDGSARIQTVSYETHKEFYELIHAFYELTGCPILLNTSFNVREEPIVCTPEDALRCFILADMDFLVLENVVIEKDKNNFDFLKLYLQSVPTKKEGIQHQVYTFI